MKLLKLLFAFSFLLIPVEATKAHKNLTEKDVLIASNHSSSRRFEVTWDTRDKYTGKTLELKIKRAAACTRPPLGGEDGKGIVIFDKSSKKVSVSIVPCVADPINEPVVRMPDGRVLYLVDSN